MSKFILCLFFIYVSFYSCRAKESKELEEQTTTSDTLINIDFQTGDYSRSNYRITIHSIGTRMMASKIEPNYFYGKNTDSIWTVQLDSIKLKFIEKFIAKARQLNGECPEYSESVDNYFITIIGDTIYSTSGDCDWNGYDYYSLEKFIFRNKFDELQLKRKKATDSVINSLTGKWHVLGLKTKMNRNDTLKLQRKGSTSEPEPNTVWEFKKDSSFKSFENKIFDLTYSDYYEINVNNGYLSLNIGPGAVTSAKGYISIENYGGQFNILAISESEILLEFWWR